MRFLFQVSSDRIIDWIYPFIGLSKDDEVDTSEAEANACEAEADNREKVLHEENRVEPNEEPINFDPLDPLEFDPIEGPSNARDEAYEGTIRKPFNEDKAYEFIELRELKPTNV